MLHGRGEEQKALIHLLDGARGGRSGVLVVRGEAGIGKSALLEFAAGEARDLRVLHGMGIESETELPFAGLHLLFAGMTERIRTLPGAQGDALRGALGLTAAPPRDRFLVGLAVLGLLADLAEDQPLLCLVDDAHWLDRSTADTLLFAARRLEAERAALVFAARETDAPEFPATGLPELRLGRLAPGPADALLAEHFPGLPHQARVAILAEADGNPLALRELPTAGRVDDAARSALPMHNRILRTFAEQISGLPERTQTMLLVLAADATGETAVLLPAGARLGCSTADLVPAEQARLVVAGNGRLDLRHPLIRAAVYRTAPLTRQLAVHRALSEVFDEQGNICQHAWHLAAATVGLDEEVAAVLERSAEADRALSGYASVAAAYERAADLSPEPAPRGRRLIAAAEAAVEAGHLDRATELANRASSYPAEPTATAQLALIRAALTVERGGVTRAHRILADAAAQVAGPLPDIAACLLFWAVECAWTTRPPEAVRAIGEILRQTESLSGPRSEQIRRLAEVVTALANPAPGAVGRASSALAVLVESSDTLDSVAERYRLPIRRREATLGWWHLLLGADERADELASGLERQSRALGALGVLPPTLALLTWTRFHAGHRHDALASGTEGVRIAMEIGQRQHIAALSAALAHLAAVAGDEDECVQLAKQATSADVPTSTALAQAALSLLDLGLSRHDAALDRLVLLCGTPVQFETLAAVPDLVEVAVRLGASELAAESVTWHNEWAAANGKPWARAVAARCAALLASDEAAENHFTTALALHREQPARPFERARTELLYGEWLRRVRRSSDARPWFRAAAETFERLGAVPWARRALNELRATGEHRDTAAPQGDLAGRLTPQELAVVRLAATGLSNREIGTRLFLSPRTVGYHLYKAFPKLGITSRTQLPQIVRGR